MIKNWKKEVARDVIALGSIPFYLIVIVRVLILKNPDYLFKFIFAGALFLLLYAIFKSNLHLGFGFILLVFLSLNYEDRLFTIMAIVLYLGMIVSAVHLNIKRSMVVKGVAFGAISTITSYLAASLIF